VDDEHNVVNYLYDLFLEKLDWEMEIFKAYSAIEAVEYLEKTHMDVVVSDISMPKMSGIELMDYIFKYWNDTRMIFLTGCDEFSYVYDAISREGVNYLLKTEDDNRLLEMVEQAILAIKKSNEDTLRKNRNQSLLQLLEYRDILSDYVTGRMSFADVSPLLSPLTLPVDIHAPVLLMIAQLQISLGNRYNIYAGLNLLMTEYLSSYFVFLQVDYKENKIIWFLQPSDKTTSFADPLFFSKIQDGVERLIESCSTHLNITPSFIITKEPLLWDKINHRISEILFETRGLTELDVGTISFYNEVISPVEIYEQYIDLSGKIDLLNSYLEENNEKEYYTLLESIIACLVTRTSVHDNYAIEYYTRLGLLLLSYINRNQLLDQLAFKMAIGRLMQYANFLDWKEATDYIQQLSEYIFALHGDELQKKKNSLVLHVESYIEEHLAGDLSLVTMGDALHYNPSYLSRIFKQMTGTNLLTYIVNKKLKESLLLLTQTDKNINAIARLVGFETPSYFIKVFRKNYGITPQEYRKVNS
jgi:two-component system response regulator YesN